MKARLRKRILIVPALLIIVILLAYHFSYPIKLNWATLPNDIADYYSQYHHDQPNPSIALYSGVEIGRKAYYLIGIGEDLGAVTMEKGITGRYKFTHLSYGSGNFLDGIIEDNGRKYVLFGGRDSTAQISRITARIGGQSYELTLPNESEHFLLYTEINSQVEDAHVDRNYLAFYNKNGEDITNHYSLSGGGI